MSRKKKVKPMTTADIDRFLGTPRTITRPSFYKDLGVGIETEKPLSAHELDIHIERYGLPIELADGGYYYRTDANDVYVNGTFLAPQFKGLYRQVIKLPEATIDSRCAKVVKSSKLRDPIEAYKVILGNAGKDLYASIEKDILVNGQWTSFMGLYNTTILLDCTLPDKSPAVANVFTVLRQHMSDTYNEWRDNP